MRRLPETLRRKIIAELYRRADKLDWDGLLPAERSTWYTRWLEDPDIGGILDAYMTRDQARLWIKDTPMKHYNRARSGIGPYAEFTERRLPDAHELVKLAFGDKCDVIPNSIRDKANRCRIAYDDKKALVIWGSPRTLQSLIWGAHNAILDEVDRPIILVVCTQGERLSEGQMLRHRRLGRILHVPVRHITVSATRRYGKSSRA